MKIIGVGLNKTGTTTLGAALEELGFKDHMSYDLGATQAWHEGKISDVLNIVQTCNNLEDWPWPLVYKEIYERFEDSMFVLTTRKNEQIWYKSLCNHAERTGPTEFRKLIYGFEMPHQFKSEHINFYLKHNQEVRNFFSQRDPSRFIEVCWENSDGWNKLCNFLNLPVPSKDFPFLNKGKPKTRPSIMNRIMNKLKP